MRSMVFFIFALGSMSAVADAILISGEVAADQSQKIIAPMSANWSLRIDWMAEEGTPLKKGDVAVRFDNSANDSQVIQVQEKHEKTRAEGARTIARLEKEERLARYDAEIAGIRLQKLKEARLKSELDQTLADNDLVWFRKLAKGNVISAEMDGFILYKRHPWTRSKFRAGDNVQTSFYVAEVVDTRNMYVRLFINAVDRTHLKPEMPVKVFLDAYPDRAYSGKITEMLVQGESRKEWGKGLYMQGRVVFNPDQDLPALMPGMSALVEASP